ncbi:apolipoprotein D-like [Brevipalpus obovatus]|uniref:apolipoprotein D-like n=1 Tax=Brevipalpus obovatus TaxID=246614 RepID=UPI003D9F0970
MYILLIAFFISPALGMSIDNDLCPPFTPPGPGFDLNKYLGVWYEIARTDMLFEAGLDCVNATYTLRDDKNITVLNQGKDLETKKIQFVQGVGRLTQQANLLEVKLSPLYPEAPYWIVDTDFSTYSLVYSCGKIGPVYYREVYILSRYREMDETLRGKLIQKSVDLGIQRENIYLTKQLECIHT